MAGVNGSDGFAAELAALGFHLLQRDRQGTLQYARKPNRFLTEWVHDDGSRLLFTWEFEMGEYCESMGWQIGAAETSFQILFPQFDARLERDAQAVVNEVDRLEQRLSGLNLADPSL